MMATIRTVFFFLSLTASWAVNAFDVSNIPRCRQQRTDSWRLKGLISKGESINNEWSTVSIERRRLWIQAAESLALTSLLVGTSNPLMVRAQETGTIVVTGASSGIGKEACRRLASRGYRLVLACRTLDRAKDTVKDLQNELSKVNNSGDLIAAECDLASMQSIRSFATTLPELIGPQTLVDAVCLNAGLSRNTAATDVARTVDGFELTVGTNHFGHFYLSHLLLPRINPINGRIVVTASGVHDPDTLGGAQGTPASLGDLSGLEKHGRNCEMLDGSRFNADKAYKDSKLCNVLFTRELQRRLNTVDGERGITANCFSPGLIVGTGLFRDQNRVFTKLFDIAATDLFKVGETPDWGGGCLEYLVSEVNSRGQYYDSPPGSSKFGDSAYGKQFTIRSPSREAQDDAKANRLWELSEKCLGLKV